jgi:hypothetical protein
VADVTLETFHRDKSALKEEAPENFTNKKLKVSNLVTEIWDSNK